jgi:hypothetical protein
VITLSVLEQQIERIVPKHLARLVHNYYFDPQHEEFAPRTMWSLSNAFTSAFKELEAIPGRRPSWEHFLKALTCRERVVKVTSAGGKCE